METSIGALPPLQSSKLLDQVRERIRYMHYSIRTEQAYVHWVRAFIRFHGLRHPVDDIDIEIGGLGADKLSNDTDVDDADAGGSTGGAGRVTRRARHLRARMPLGTYAVALHMAA